jgi:hypothetical protein
MDEARQKTVKLPAKWAVAAAGVVIMAGGVVWLAPSGDAPAWQAVAPTQQPAGQDEPTLSSPPHSATASGPSCNHVTGAFDPRTIVISGVTRGAAVVTPPRDTHGLPGTPPLTDRGKLLFAWDRAQGVRPGDSAGNVLLNAHTWPDGSALGNKLLAGLQRGDQVILVGVNTRLCYRVTERVEVLAERGLPRYYDSKGPPQLAIVVCSGRRLGPGVWEKRTVWFASPSFQAPYHHGQHS